VAQSAQWKVIHIARSESNALRLVAALEKEGFLARTRQVHRTLSPEENYYEIMVPGTEAMEAHQLLTDSQLLL